MSIAAVAVLAKSGEAVKSGPIGLAVILILCIACYFLFKSMSKHLKTVREDFPQGAPAQPAETEPATGQAHRVADPAPSESTPTSTPRSAPTVPKPDPERPSADG